MQATPMMRNQLGLTKLTNLPKLKLGQLHNMGDIAPQFKSSNNSRTITLSLMLLLFATQLLIDTNRQSSPLLLAAALKVSVAIPELVKLNDAFWLNCSQNSNTNNNANQLASSSSLLDDQQQTTNRAEIYAIKWYKDEEEFYRYLPNAEPKVSIYETNGIQLDQSKSFQGNVFITKADVHSEGNYRCEILSEAPIFETVRKSKHLKVYALPVRGPKIEILDSSGRPKHPKDKEFSYAVGDKIELRCNSMPSKPAARLRWYLNDHELIIPATSNSMNGTQQAEPKLHYNRQGAQQQHQTSNQQQQNYNVRVTPIEYRQHYKGIYSSHSTLSFILQQNDLVNSRISFKCLASMRQEIPVQSKQLIVLTPQQQQQQHSAQVLNSLSSSSNRFRFKRHADLLLVHELTADPSNDHSSPTPKQRHRAQYNRRLSSSGRAMQQQQQSSAATNSNPIRELISSGQAADDFQLSYVHEESDSTLGPSIIDSPELLEKYLGEQQQANSYSSSEVNNSTTASSNYALDFNRGDNLDYIQFQRDRLAKQRQLPNTQVGVGGAGTLLTTASKSHRLHGSINSIVRSPLYLDELDSLRPIINWPPIESGKLMLLPPGNTIVAIATSHQPPQQQQQSNSNQQSAARSELRFVLPPKQMSGASIRNQQQQQQTRPVGQLILEKLMENLNCTCTEGSIDTKLGWSINDLSLTSRDTRYYPTRISPDHRQTWLTIGLQTSLLNSNHLAAPMSTTTTPSAVVAAAAKSSSNAVSLQSILSQYYNKPPPIDGHQSAAGHSAKLLLQQQQQQPLTNEQIRFICQAIHSMLLYSGSEMITFDFNPPPANELDGNTNSIDKFQSQPSNVIQATSASQSSSASQCGGLAMPKSIWRSHHQSATAATIMINALLLLTTLYSFSAALQVELFSSGYSMLIKRANYFVGAPIR